MFFKIFLMWKFTAFFYLFLLPPPPKSFKFMKSLFSCQRIFFIFLGLWHLSDSVQFYFWTEFFKEVFDILNLLPILTWWVLQERKVIGLENVLSMEERPISVLCSFAVFVVFWPFDPTQNAIQGDAPEGSDTFQWQLCEEIAWAEIGWWNGMS